MKQITKILTLVLFIGIIFSCDDTDNTDDMEGANTAPTADAGDDITITLGETVNLDGGNSSDADNDPLSYSWELTSQPSGSSVSINNNENVQVQFTPDVAGSYTATLTVSDDDDSDDSDDESSEEDTDEVVITVEEPEQQTVEINSNVSENTTWEDIFEDDTPDYRVTRTMSVDDEVTLTIAPGVIVEFESDRGMDINGALIADGTASDNIIFTGVTKEKGFWRGIAFYSPNVNNLLNHVTVEYGGSSSIGFGLPEVNVGVENGDKLKVTNSSFNGSTGYGLFFESGSEIEEFSNNSFSDNDEYPLGLALNNVGMLDQASTYSNNVNNEVAVFGSSLDLNNEIEWKKFNDETPFRVLGRLIVNSGLFISEGVMMKFASDVGLEVSNDGYLKALGTENDKVVFTGETEAAGFWQGIVIYTNNVQNELDHVVVSYGGSSAFGFGIPKVNVGIENGDQLKISNSEISHSAEYGVFCELGSSLEGFSNNNLHDNGSYPISLSAANATQIDATSSFNVGNGDNSVNILGNTLNEGSTELTLRALSNETPYYLTGNLSIQSGLVIEDGVDIEVAVDNQINVSNEGYLIADGTDSEGISFTGKTKSPGAWQGIVIYTNDVRNLLNYVTVSHGGSSDVGFGVPKVNIGVENGDRLTVTNCTITDCDGIGLFGEAGSTLTQSNNTFSNNVVDLEIN